MTIFKLLKVVIEAPYIKRFKKSCY